MFQGGHELHERAKVLLIDALLSQLYQELQHLHSVGKVALVSYTPHEEKGHLQCNTQNLMSVFTVVVGLMLLYTARGGRGLVAMAIAATKKDVSTYSVEVIKDGC